MRILITGGAGFIGASLANRLVREGHQVRVLDDLSAGDPARLAPEVHFTRGDVRDVPRLWTLLQDVNCVYHLAARVSVPESILYPRDYNDVNVGGTVSLLEAVRDVGVKRAVLTSSGAVYGEQEKQPISEKAIPHPASPYAASKVAAECYVSTIGALYGIETVILRIFNTYGPGQFVPPAHPPVIPQFLKQAISGGSLVIFGDGNQTRDFVYIDDVVDALVAAGTAEGIDGKIVNVGSGQEMSINELVRKLERVLGKSLNVLYNRTQSGGVSRLVADITLARKLLGFEPKVNIEKGLELMLTKDPQFQK